MKKSYLCARKSIFTPRNRPFTDAKRDSDNVVPTNRIFRFDGLPRAQRQSQQVQDQRENRQAHHRRGQQSKLQAESAGQRFAHAENQHDRTARAGDRQPLLRQHRQHRHQRNEPARSTRPCWSTRWAPPTSNGPVSNRSYRAWSTASSSCRAGRNPTRWNRSTATARRWC